AGTGLSKSRTPPRSRRAARRLTDPGGLASLAAACQAAVPVETPITPPPLPPAPTPVPTEAVVTPGLRLALDVDPDTLDPAGQTNPTTSSIVDHMAETLVRVQQDGRIGPGLARRSRQPADGKGFTFELRQDVEFDDGPLRDA